ncbi:MAG: hypothetical protein QOH67_261 [Hyphomicrobiales bacterium]|jgi:hypothetical protein|nr:hypothetical protein [Hyphomicrobiales bacterium]
MLKQLWSCLTGAFLFGFFAALFAAAALFATPASAQPEIIPSDQTWTVQPAFGQAGEGRDNVSGVTCIGAVTERPVCLVVNDSARFAQFFTIGGQTIRSGPLAGLSGTAPPSRLIGTPNMEGAAHDDRFFYVVTSKDRPSFPPQVDTDFLVARFPSDINSTPPAPPATVPGLEVSDRFRAALTAGIPVPGLANQKIDRTNSDIQGIAITPGASVRGEGVVNLGFRNPVIGGKAFIVSADVSKVFAASGAFTPTVTPVALGTDVGISDLAKVDDGILILAASNRSVQQRHSLFLLQNDGQLKHLADVAQPTDRKAEALLVLRDDPEFYLVLLMFDGVANGGPLQYFVPR